MIPQHSSVYVGKYEHILKILQGLSVAYTYKLKSFSLSYRRNFYIIQVSNVRRMCSLQHNTLIQVIICWVVHIANATYCQIRICVVLLTIKILLNCSLCLQQLVEKKSDEALSRSLTSSYTYKSKFLNLSIM